MARGYGAPRGRPGEMARVFGAPRGRRVDLARVFGTPRGRRVDLARVFGTPRGRRVDLTPGCQSITTPLFLSFSSENSKSEGFTKSAMRNLKQEDFPGRKRLRADVFVHENYDRIRRR